MNKLIFTGITLILITSNAIAEDKVILKAKNTFFPNISNEYTIEQFLWAPPENERRPKWWKPETYAFGNDRGNCRRQVWTRTNNDITVSCTIVETSWTRTGSPLNVPFFGVDENNRTDQAYDESSMRWVRFINDWPKIKKFRDIQNSPNLRNFYYRIIKPESNEYGKAIIYVNLPRNTISNDLNLDLLSAQSTNPERPYPITVSKKEFISGKADFSDYDHGGEDPAFNNGYFYGSDFQILYKDFLSSFIECFNKKDENSKIKLLKSYKNLIFYKLNLWNIIAKQFNVQYIMRDSMTLDIKIHHLPTGQFKISDAYTTARWADGTQKKFRIENTPEKTILTVKKSLNKPGLGDKERNNPNYEKLLETFWGVDLFEKKIFMQKIYGTSITSLL